MQGIIPQELGGGATASTNVRALAFALANMLPDLWVPILPGESWEKLLARREAARDMLDELLVEFAAAGEVAV